MSRRTRGWTLVLVLGLAASLVGGVRLYGATPAGRFQSTGLGSVIDTVTGLTWQETEDAVDRSFTTALSYCGELILDSQSDWRVPTVKELLTLADATATTLDTTIFLGRSGSYWSSTNLSGDANNVWYASFSAGATPAGTAFYDLKTATKPVRCVRP